MSGKVTADMAQITAVSTFHRHTRSFRFHRLACGSNADSIDSHAGSNAVARVSETSSESPTLAGEKYTVEVAQLRGVPNTEQFFLRFVKLYHQLTEV